MKMVASRFPALEPRAPAPHSSVCSLRKAVAHSCLLGLWLHSMLTWTMTKPFYLRPTTLFQVSKPGRHMQCTHAIPPGGQWAISLVLPLAGPLLGGKLPDRNCSGLRQPQAEIALQGLLIRASFPSLMPGSSATLRLPHSF